MDDVTTIVPELPDRETLWVTDAELIRRMGVPEKIARQCLRMLDADRTRRFPQKSKFWGNRRYWPAVRKWLDESNGLTMEASQSRRQAYAR